MKAFAFEREQGVFITSDEDSLPQAIALQKRAMAIPGRFAILMAQHEPNLDQECRAERTAKS